MKSQLNIDVYPYVEYNEAVPMLGASVYIGDGDPLCAFTEPMRDVFDFFIGGHLVGNSISDEDREYLLTFFKDIKYMAKEFIKNVKAYEAR